MFKFLEVLASGRDATEEFDDVGHSKAAVEQMKDFYVGECPQAAQEKLTSAVAADSGVRVSASTPAPTKSGGILSKILQFLVPLVLLGVAVALRKYSQKEDVKA